MRHTQLVSIWYGIIACVDYTPQKKTLRTRKGRVHESNYPSPIDSAASHPLHKTRGEQAVERRTNSPATQIIRHKHKDDQSYRKVRLGGRFVRFCKAYPFCVCMCEHNANRCTPVYPFTAFHHNLRALRLGHSSHSFINLDIFSLLKLSSCT